MQTELIRIGTRGSALALAQAREARSRLMAAHGLPESAFEITVITTSGDRIQDRSLAQAGGKGLFTKELEEALFDGRIDFAVHSSKDMPTELPPGLVLSAFLEREDVRDAFIGRKAARLADLPRGALLGTSSLRRQALALRLRPDLRVGLFRGNVQTRLKKLEDGVADATLLAVAGLKRLDMLEVAGDIMPVEDFPPALGQGAICIESRQDDQRVAALVAAIGHVPTAQALTCERAFLTVLDGSCRMPIAGHARVSGGALRFSGMVLALDGSKAHEARLAGDAADAASIGAEAGRQVRAAAGERFFEGWS